MKKLFIIFTVLCMIFCTGASAQNAPDTYIENTLEPLLRGEALLFSTGDTITDEQGLIYELTSDGAVVSGCTEDVAENIEIPPLVFDGNNYQYWVVAIKDCVFQTANNENANNIKTVKIGHNVKKIGNLAFDGCSELESVEIDAAALIEIGNTPFRNCSKLKEINVVGNNENFRSSEGVLYGKARDFTDSQKLKTAIIAYPAAKTDESYTVTDGTELVAVWSFDGCVNLKNITVPSSVKTIDGYAFDGCTALENITLSEGIETIGDGAFQYCSAMDEINFPKSLKSLGTRPLFGCDTMENVTVTEGNSYFTVVDGVLYTQDKTELVYYPPKLSMTEYIIPDGVKTIRSGAFFRAYNIEKLVMADSVEKIEEYGIRSCTSMEECELSDNLTSMGKECISFCSSLEELTLPEGLKSIPDKAFTNCSSLTTVNIPQSVVSISSDAFTNCGDVKICGEDGSFADQYAQVNGYGFTVTDVRIKFVTDCVTEIEDRVYPVNTAIEEPPALTKTYFTFDGWYTDKSFTDKWDFADLADSSMTLYAKWTAIPYKVEFKDNKLAVSPVDETPKKVFIASYDENGRMVDVIMRDAADLISVDELESAFEIRAFLWSGLENVMPLCVRAYKQ